MNPPTALPNAQPAALPGLRSNSLALSFQDVLTVILRVRYRVQRVSDVAGFRDSIRKMIAAAVGEARRIGYSDKTSTMSLYAIVGFLDESVLNSQDPTFQDWARRPLQEEMFGGHFAGEYFFRHVDELLNQQESPEVADTLELHALCLLLGYRGKYAFGDHGEIGNILRRIRDKIARIRGPVSLLPTRPAPPVSTAASGDRWIKRLVLTTALAAVLVIAAFAAYTLFLRTGLEGVRAQLTSPNPLVCHSRRESAVAPLVCHSRRESVVAPLVCHSRRESVVAPLVCHSRREFAVAPLVCHSRRESAVALSSAITLPTQTGGQA